MRFSRREAYRVAREIRVAYEVSYREGEDYEEREMVVSREHYAHAIYMAQDSDEERVAHYVVYHIVVGDDSDSIAVRGVRVV